MDSRNLNGLENHSSLGGRGTLVGTRIHLRGMGIHSSIRFGCQCSQITLELGTLCRPLAAIVSRECES